MVKSRPSGRVIYRASSSKEFFTPARLRELVSAVLGRVELDPCTIEANPLCAAAFYTRRENGLVQPWRARSIYVNPPYGLEIVEWIDRCIEVARADQLVRLLALVPARPGARWYKRASLDCQLRCELDGRQVFERRNGKPMPAGARWGSVFFYWGHERAAVARVLRPHGLPTFFRALPPPRPSNVVDIRQLTIEGARR